CLAVGVGFPSFLIHVGSSIIITCFLISLQRSLPSTLFPYTTLFRSVVGQTQRDEVLDDEPVVAVGELTGGDPGGIGGDEDGGAVDRKSTRLNSSHVSISYAVFCLKKKIKTKYQAAYGFNDR